jgi:hypothetical protein
MSFSRTEVAAACRKWAKWLRLPDGAEIDGARLLWAMSGNESTFGEHCTRRHEPGWCTGGDYQGHTFAPGVYSDSLALIKLTQLYEHLAHCSFGPWQILLINSEQPCSPEAMVSIDRAAFETVKFLNRRILHAQGATTVEQVGIAWNSGSLHHPNDVPEGVARYAADLREYYDHEPMPAEVAPMAQPGVQQ